MEPKPTIHDEARRIHALLVELSKRAIEENTMREVQNALSDARNAVWIVVEESR